MPYFRLHPDCYWIDGKNGSAIYDLPARRVFLLDGEAGSVLRHCQRSLPLNDEDLTGGVREFLDTLVSEQLGSYYTSAIYVDKLLLNSPVARTSGMLGPPPSYRRVSWSISGRCEHQCSFCPHVAAASASWSACRSCVRCQGDTDSADLFSDVDHVVKRLAALGITVFHIRGGNPFLEWDRLNAILRSLSKYPYMQIVVTGPGTGAPVDEVVEMIAGANARMNVVLSGVRSPFDTTNVVAEVLDDQRKLLDTLQRRHVKQAITINVTGGPMPDCGVTAESMLKRWGVPPVFAEFYPLSVAATESFSSLSVENNRKPLFIWRTVGEFFERMGYSSCLHGSLEVSVSGSIRPCAGCSDECGRIKKADIGSALRDSPLYDLWNRSKDTIDTCMDCAMRYVCCDCLAAEKMGVQISKVAAAYCPAMRERDLYSGISHFEHNDWIYLLSVREGVRPCPKQ